MSSFTYTINRDIFADHPHYRRGVIVFKALDNSQANAKLTALLRLAENGLRQRIAGNPAEYPHIAAWRDAYRQFGTKPSEHRSSIEALSRRVLKPDNLPDINPLVDIGNLVSLRHVLPAGVHPIGPASKDVTLRKTAADDRFLPGPGEAPETIAPGEIVLAAGSRVLTRRWTWRQAGDTRTLANTDCVFFDIDGLPPVSREDVTAAMSEIVSLVDSYCGGVCVGQTILDAENRRFSVSLD
ncbi:B3/B4 domain-containing protein [Pseudomonas hunanensis]|uniref:B3/B4 domain-containing protein n=1 Tax=Pseudomonas hunanensis TaxID=1247546 RepID=UPI0015BBCCAD